MSGGDAPQHLPLGEVLVEEGVRAEPAPVQQMRGIAERRARGGRHHFVPVAVVLAPERRAPRPVEFGEVAVATLQPPPERPRAVGGSSSVSCGSRVRSTRARARVRGGRRIGWPSSRRGRGSGRGRSGGTRAPRLPAADLVPVATLVHGPDLGMRGREPRRWGRGRGGQVDADAAVVQEVEDAVEPAEIPRVRSGLEPGPGEDADGGEVDTSLAHEFDVALPDLFRPLLGVVVTAEGNAPGRPPQVPPAGIARCVHAHNLSDPCSKVNTNEHFCTYAGESTSGWLTMRGAA